MGVELPHLAAAVARAAGPGLRRFPVRVRVGGCGPRCGAGSVGPPWTSPTLTAHGPRCTVYCHRPRQLPRPE